jgi:hypothetical protein
MYPVITGIKKIKNEKAARKYRLINKYVFVNLSFRNSFPISSNIRSPRKIAVLVNEALLK